LKTCPQGLNLEKVVTRDEAFAADTAAAVQYNADLLNLLVTRVNSLEAATTLTSGGFQKLSDFATDGLQKSSDYSADLDKKLRQHIDEAVALMKVDVERLEKVAQAAQPGVDFGQMGKAFDTLRTELTSVSARLAESFELLQTQQTAAVARLESLEGTSTEVEKRALQNFAVLATKLTELESMYHGSGAAPAPAQTAPAAAPWAVPATAGVDPMAGGNDSWAGKFLGGGSRAPTSFGGRPPSVPIYNDCRDRSQGTKIWNEAREPRRGTKTRN
jgi:hypothetical protein